MSRVNQGHKENSLFLNRKIIQIISGIALFFSFVCVSEALEIKVQNQEAAQGENIVVQVSVLGYSTEEIAATAFTIEYKTEYLILEHIESSFFDSFNNQWALLPSSLNPAPPSSVVVGGQTFTQPLLFNTAEGSSKGKTMIAGIRVSAGNPVELLTLHFSIKPGTPDGVYPFTIMPTVIRDVIAGYGEEGEVIPIFVGFDESTNDPEKTFPEYNPSIVNGAVYVGVSFIDSDNDGIDDNWEILWFGDLTTASNMTDFDKDGYSDLQEYLNASAGETDPEGNVYNLVVRNSPEGTGFIENISMNKAFWNLILPAILSGRK